MRKIRVLEIVNQLGLGGTEYALQLFAKFFNKAHFDVTVISLLKGGERVQQLKDLGISVIVLNGDFTQLPTYLQEADVVHWHGGGSLESELFQILKKHKPRLVIQTNVFGLYDSSPLYKVIDYDLYISKMILVRRMELDKNLDDSFSSKRKVLPYPVDVDHINELLPTNQEVDQFKTTHGLHGHFIVGRIGRPDNNKFDLITLDGFAKFAKEITNTKFLLAGATDEMIAHANSLAISDKLVIIENTVELKTLLLYYKAMDVFLAASQIGESFGMVIAEAMTVGTPVVTISTPDRDNALVELMDNEVSGLVVKRSKTAIAGALKYLYETPEDRIKLSNNSRTKIEKDYKAQKIVKSLEHLILVHFNGSINEHADENLVKDFSQEMMDDYKKRRQNLYGGFKILNQALSKFKAISKGFKRS
jgi:glycosyltransferase involved in cell wall biosynthesis